MLLRIGVLQGNDVVEERLVRPDQSVSFGSAPDNTFVVDAVGLPRSVTLFEVEAGRTFLTFSSEQSGHLEQTGQRGSLAALTSSADKRDDRYRVALDTTTARGRIKLGDDVTILFHFASAPVVEKERARWKSGLIGQIEPTFTAVLVSSLIVHAALGLVVKLAAPPTPPELDELRKIVQTITPPNVAAPRIDVPRGVHTTSTAEVHGGVDGARAHDDRGNAAHSNAGTLSGAALKDAIGGRGILSLIGGTSHGRTDVDVVFGSAPIVSDDVTRALHGTNGVDLNADTTAIVRRSERHDDVGDASAPVDIGALAPRVQATSSPVKSVRRRSSRA